jgi:alanine transaminase
MKQIKAGNGSEFGFKSTTSLNIGNPQAVGQGHISFNREVISACLNPALLKTDALSNDAKVRAQKYMSLLETPMGAYTSNSKGFGYAREKVAEFISKRDNVPAFDSGNIYLTNGAGEGVKLLFSMLISGKNDGIMIPIP